MVCVEGVEERGGYRGMGAGVRVWRERRVQGYGCMCEGVEGEEGRGVWVHV